MVSFPLHFSVQASAKSGVKTTWTCSNEHVAAVPCSIPPEFGGQGNGGYSPEDFFAFAVMNCIIATFKVYMEMSKVQFSEITGKAQATLNKSPAQGGMWVSDLEITLDVKGAADKAKAKILLDKSVQDCAVSNSIKSAKSYHLTVS